MTEHEGVAISTVPSERRVEFGALARGGLVSLSDAQRTWQVSANAAAARLARYHRRGWLRRVRRGLYLVLPLEADPRGAVTVEDPWLLARELFAPCYVGGWSAAEHWELTEQIFRSVFVISAASVRSVSAAEGSTSSEWTFAWRTPRRSTLPELMRSGEDASRSWFQVES